MFAERGWAGGTIREIAARAWVTHGLVVLHLATKHDLFVAALAGTRDLTDQVRGDREGLPRRIATGYVRRMESADEADPFIVIVRSATDQDAARALLSAIRSESIEAYRSILDVDDVEIRVDLVGTLLIGVTLNRDVLAGGPLAALCGAETVAPPCSQYALGSRHPTHSEGRSVSDLVPGRQVRARPLVLVSMTFANAMVLVDQTAVPLILPSVMQEFSVGTQLVQWMLTASLLPLAGLLVFGGRLGDLFGHRRVFILGTIVFAAASACAGLSPDFGVLIVFRVLQGAGGALMLPTTIAVVSRTYPGAERGRALGIMGGAAAIAGALGPAIGGGLTSWLGWRAVLLVNVPLAVIAIVAALVAVQKDGKTDGPRHVDIVGTVLLSVTLIGIVFGLSQSQDWGWTSPGVIVPLVVAIAAGVGFVMTERRSRNPLMDFSLLRTHPNYLGATLSQALAGMAEMGLGILFPLLLILNLGMDPGLAGLALIPATLPMIVLAPLAGRWYDKVGGRPPLALGFIVLALSGVFLAIGVHSRDYWLILPGFLVYGIGLALILTVNDPVSLDTVPERDHGQASGVSATAEQFGGALGIAVLYLIYHTTYVARLHIGVDASPFADLSDAQYAQLRDDILAAENTGLNPATFDPTFREYIGLAFDASIWGMSIAFLAVTVISVVGCLVVVRLVRKPQETL